MKFNKPHQIVSGGPLLQLFSLYNSKQIKPEVPNENQPLFAVIHILLLTQPPAQGDDEVARKKDKIERKKLCRFHQDQK